MNQGVDVPKGLGLQAELDAEDAMLQRALAESRAMMDLISHPDLPPEFLKQEEERQQAKTE